MQSRPRRALGDGGSAGPEARRAPSELLPRSGAALATPARWWPVRGLRVGRCGHGDAGTKAVVQPWNATEVGTFITAMKGDRLYAPLLLSLMGLRPAEVCGLRWADTDLGAATLSIAKTRTLMGNALPALVGEALKAFRATQAKGTRAAGTCSWTNWAPHCTVGSSGCGPTRSWTKTAFAGSVCTMLGRLAWRTSPTRCAGSPARHVGRAHQREDDEEVVREAGRGGPASSSGGMGRSRRGRVTDRDR